MVTISPTTLVVTSYEMCSLF